MTYIILIISLYLAGWALNTYAFFRYAQKKFPLSTEEDPAEQLFFGMLFSLIPFFWFLGLAYFITKVVKND